MRLEKTILNESFVHLNNEEVVEVFSECYNLVAGLLKVDSILTSEQDYARNNLKSIDFEYFQLDTLEELLDIAYPKTLEIFATGLCSGFTVCNRRAKDALSYYRACIELVKAYTTAYVPLTEKEVQKLKERVTETLGHLAYFLYYQFGMGNTADSFVEGIEIVVDFAFNKFCDVKGLDFRNVINDIKAIAWTFRPHLPIFEEFPELEEEFYDIAGPYVQDFDLLEEKLNIETVKQIIKGDCDIEQLISSLEQ